MKIKSDFVTNSSSSSFIVVMPKQVKTQEDVDELVQRSDYAERLFFEMKDQTPLKRHDLSEDDMEYILNLLKEGTVFGLPSSYDLEEEIVKREGIDENKLWGGQNYAWRLQVREEVDEKGDDYIMKHFEEFLGKMEEGYIYNFEFDDGNGGTEAELERGEGLEFITHTRINKH